MKLLLLSLALSVAPALAVDDPFHGSASHWEKPYLPTRLEVLTSIKRKVDTFIYDHTNLGGVNPPDYAMDLWYIDSWVCSYDGWMTRRIDFDNQYWRNKEDEKKACGPEATLMLEALQVGINTLIDRESSKK